MDKIKLLIDESAIGTDKFEDRKRTLWKIKKERKYEEDEHLSVNGIKISFTYVDNILEWTNVENGIWVYWGGKAYFW